MRNVNFERMNATLKNFLPQVMTIAVFLCSFTIQSQAQELKNNNKLSPFLNKNYTTNHLSFPYAVIITVIGKQQPDYLKNAPAKISKIYSFDSLSIYRINIDFTDLQNLLSDRRVIFIEDANRTAKDEALIQNLDLSLNKINVVHNKYPQYNGNGLLVSIKENRPDSTDIDLAGRYIPIGLSSPILSSHANNMATMIAGAGNSWHLGKGAAWGANITSSDYINLLPDPDSVFRKNNISVQNHSYGVGIENLYAPDAAAYDAQLVNNNSLLHVFSSGNSGNAASVSGTYAGVTGFANLTGSFKMAKNIITVGATDSFGNVAPQSSKGPAYDGRVKPEIVAFGIDGSSGAAALVSGITLMLQHQYKLLYGTLPENNLIRSVLINSADDVGNKEVDFSSGFGSLNAYNAIKTIESGRFFSGTVSTSGIQNFSIPVPAGIKKLKVTLAWTDPAANINSGKALVNDLDLVLNNSATLETWQPWVLNKFPHVDSLKQPASRKRDSLNNVEQITVDNPTAGLYQVQVKAFAVTGSQKFSISYQLDSTDVFEWYFPMSQDPVLRASLNTIRWRSSFAATTGKLEYSTDGVNWQLIDASADLTKNYYNWATPAITSLALLRMTINNQSFVSDTFVIAARTQTGVGFNCPDSVLLYWTKISPAISYRIYTMGNKYLQQVTLTPDSFKVLQKSAYPSKYFAVAPIINGKEGVRSYTIDYTLQGVGCYVRSFFATLLNTTAVLDLSLGSLYNINKIVLEKFDGQTFKQIQQKTNFNSTQISFTDNQLTAGLNIYRIRLELQGGGISYSVPENVFYFNDKNYVIYPNPVAQNQVIQVAQQEVDLATMQVYNSNGQKVYEKVIDDRINTIPAGILSKGLFFVKFISRTGKVEAGKLVVL